VRGLGAFGIATILPPPMRTVVATHAHGAANYPLRAEALRWLFSAAHWHNGDGAPAYRGQLLATVQWPSVLTFGAPPGACA
jgi:hypothetical protein